jgi:hypothetical protein
MTFVNLKRLKAELAQAELPASETAKYLAAQGALLSLMFIPSPENEPADWAFVAHPLLAVIGVYYCYRRNGGALGARFAERYLAVGWVVGWRVALVAVPLVALGLGASLSATGSLEWLEDPRIAPAIDLGSVGLVAFVYWRIGRHLGDLRAAYPE